MSYQEINAYEFWKVCEALLGGEKGSLVALNIGGLYLES